MEGVFVLEVEVVVEMVTVPVFVNVGFVTATALAV
jgi:hypothetical protein